MKILTAVKEKYNKRETLWKKVKRNKVAYTYTAPFPQPMKESFRLAGALDLMRGIKHQTYWIMEQQSGPTGWEILGRTPRPGQLALWAAQSIAHGADVIVFFRWRTCSYGTEEYWHGILPHSGIPGRRYNELKTFIEEIVPHMESFKGALPESDVAIS